MFLQKTVVSSRGRSLFRGARYNVPKRLPRVESFTIIHAPSVDGKVLGQMPTKSLQDKRPVPMQVRAVEGDLNALEFQLKRLERVLYPPPTNYDQEVCSFSPLLSSETVQDSVTSHQLAVVKPRTPCLNKYSKPIF